MIILLFIESMLNFKNIPLNSTFKSSINYEYIVYRNENPISCFLEFLVSLNFIDNLPGFFTVSIDFIKLFKMMYPFGMLHYAFQ